MMTFILWHLWPLRHRGPLWFRLAEKVHSPWGEKRWYR